MANGDFSTVIKRKMLLARKPKIFYYYYHLDEIAFV